MSDQSVVPEKHEKEKYKIPKRKMGAKQAHHRRRASMTLKFNVRPVAASRGKNIQHVAAASAYQSRSILYAGARQFDYSQREADLVLKKILLPHSAPTKFRYRQKLCDALPLAPAFVDGLVARWLLAEFPANMNESTMKRLAQVFCKSELTEEGMCVDLAIHNPTRADKDSLPHMHAIVSAHDVQSTGFTKYRRGWQCPELHLRWQQAWITLATQEAP
jgi:hypothetical protein